ncbi:MAG TPA: ABC transporter permease [Candidatus Onthocola stercorigallinarum]|nr:ABC transporter permease [Candidatus Onthocola stercorigallinarum]
MNKTLLILKKELREVFRDKKSLAMMLIIPVLIPLIIIGMSALFESETSTDVNTYNKIGFNYELSDIELEILDSLEIDYSINDTESLEEEFNNQEINSYITKENNHYVINYDSANIESSGSASLSESFLETYKSVLEENYLSNSNVDVSEFNNLLTYEEKTQEQQNYFANYIVNYAFLFILMAITVSATYPATDATAGEKERGTLETLLTFPIKSKDIIIGKLLSVTLSSIITGVLGLILSVLAILYVGNTYDIYSGSTLLNASIIIYALIIIIAYSIMISGLCIAIASMSKSFKEAQSALTPLTFIAFFPGMIVFMIDISNNAILSLIPFINFSMIFTDVTNNNLNILYLILMLISTIVIITIVITYIIRQYKSEKILFNE